MSMILLWSREPNSVSALRRDYWKAVNHVRYSDEGLGYESCRKQTTKRQMHVVRSNMKNQRGMEAL